jgi:hypothetical protein
MVEEAWYVHGATSPKQSGTFKALINSLPKDCSSRIWGELYSQFANGAQEWQWAENHFQDYFVSFYRIVNASISGYLEDLWSHYLQAQNPNQNPIHISQFIQKFMESKQNIEFCYPTKNPNI